MRPALFLALLSGLSFLSLVESTCDELEDAFSSFVLNDLIHHSQIRIVSPSSNTSNFDSQSCLCGETGRPCATSRYALLGAESNTSNGTANVTLMLAPGNHVLHEGLPIHNSEFVALVGLGDVPHVSEIQCGVPTKSDYDKCQLKNVNIQNSSHIYISGITFGSCQPFVSAVHVQNSSHIIFENCTFRYVL